MTGRFYRTLTHRLLWMSMGTLWLGGCVTDLQARDFLSSTLLRTFWQTVASAFQAAFVEAAGS